MVGHPADDRGRQRDPVGIAAQERDIAIRRWEDRVTGEYDAPAVGARCPVGDRAAGEVAADGAQLDSREHLERLGPGPDRWDGPLDPSRVGLRNVNRRVVECLAPGRLHAVHMRVACDDRRDPAELPHRLDRRVIDHARDVEKQVPTVGLHQHPLLPNPHTRAENPMQARRNLEHLDRVAGIAQLIDRRPPLPGARDVLPFVLADRTFGGRCVATVVLDTARCTKPPVSHGPISPLTLGSAGISLGSAG